MDGGCWILELTVAILLLLEVVSFFANRDAIAGGEHDVNAKA